MTTTDYNDDNNTNGPLSLVIKPSRDIYTNVYIYTCKVESRLSYFYPCGSVNEIWPIVESFYSICFLNKVRKLWIVYLKIKDNIKCLRLNQMLRKISTSKLPIRQN